MTSVPLIATLVVGLLVVGAAVYGLHRHHRNRRREAIRERERRLEKLRREHTNRVDRLERERDRARDSGHIDFVASLLPALDSLRRAQEALDDPPEGAEPLLEGIELAREEIEETLRSYDIERIEPEPSEAFDPEVHEALRAVDDAEAAPGTILECHRPGYRFGDRTLRPAAVAVCVAAEADEPRDDEGPADEPRDADVAPPRASDSDQTDAVQARRSTDEHPDDEAEPAPAPESATSGEE